MYWCILTSGYHQPVNQVLKLARERVRQAINNIPLHTTSRVLFDLTAVFFCLFVNPLIFPSPLICPPFLIFGILLYLTSYFLCPIFHLSPFQCLITPLCLICPLCFLHPLLSGYLLSKFLIPPTPVIIPGEREALFSRLAELLSSSSPQIGVHFEMASFVEESIMEDLLHYVIPHVCMTQYSNEPAH